MLLEVRRLGPQVTCTKCGGPMLSYVSNWVPWRSLSPHGILIRPEPEDWKGQGRGCGRSDEMSTLKCNSEPRV